MLGIAGICGRIAVIRGIYSQAAVGKVLGRKVIFIGKENFPTPTNCGCIGFAINILWFTLKSDFVGVGCPQVIRRQSKSYSRPIHNQRPCDDLFQNEPFPCRA
jgi:hypothetical protein